LKGVEFDAVYTAQNIGSYKPDLKNFNYLLEGVKRDIGVGKEEVLHTGKNYPMFSAGISSMGAESMKSASKAA
jgi:FMN phosphatase YigB (HAD superfamily)